MASLRSSWKIFWVPTQCGSSDIVIKIVIKNCHQQVWSNVSKVTSLWGHSVVLWNSLIVSGARQTKQGTRSPIELLWTAKNTKVCCTHLFLINGRYGASKQKAGKSSKPDIPYFDKCNCARGAEFIWLCQYIQSGCGRGKLCFVLRELQGGAERPSHQCRVLLQPSSQISVFSISHCDNFWKWPRPNNPWCFQTPSLSKPHINKTKKVWPHFSVSDPVSGSVGRYSSSHLHMQNGAKCRMIGLIWEGCKKEMPF